MKPGLREKIFACALLAISVFFILYDQVYLSPALQNSIQKIKMQVASDVKFIEDLQKTPYHKDIIKMYMRLQGIRIDVLPLAFIDLNKPPLENDRAFEVKNIYHQAAKTGRHEGAYVHMKDLTDRYGIAIIENKAVLLISRPLTELYSKYDKDKTYLIAFCLTGLVVAFLYAYVVAKRCK